MTASPIDPAGAGYAELALAAVETAEEAGLELRARRGRDLEVRSKRYRRELVTDADRASERIVVDRIRGRFPAHAVLAEEGERTDAGRASSDSDWLWIVDPLDGTTNYVHGIPFYCVAVAVALKGRVVAAAVHAPELGATYRAFAGGGAERNGARVRVSACRDLADALLATGFAYGRTEPGRDNNLGRLAAVLPRCGDVRRLGSAELDLCLVADGRFDAFWELDLAPYDVAAGALMVQEAGGKVSDLAGGGNWLYGGTILASNGALHEAMLSAIEPSAHEFRRGRSPRVE
ncbi:MAG: inositol monophosphatase family protein [Planctomycetota bacterium]